MNAEDSLIEKNARLLTWQTVRGPLIGGLIGILLARVGVKETTFFHYFRDQEVQKQQLEDKSKNRSVDVELHDTLIKRDPRLATEPAVRVVTWFGLPVATEYAGLDARAFYPAAPWYHLPSHWSARLQFVSATVCGLIGWLIAQQRSLGELRRELIRYGKRLAEHSSE